MANEIVLYQPNEQMSLEVKLENETVWLTLNQMASLFGRDKSVISRHIKAIFQERELTYEGSVAKNATVQTEGNRQVIRETICTAAIGSSKAQCSIHTCYHSGVRPLTRPLPMH